MLWAKITIGKNNCIYHVVNSASYIRMLHRKTTEFSLFPSRQQNNDWQESPDIRHSCLTQTTFLPTSPVHQPGMLQEPSQQVTLEMMEIVLTRGQLPTAATTPGLFSTILSTEAWKNVKLNLANDSQEIKLPLLQAAAMGDRLLKRQMMALPASPRARLIAELQLCL